VTGSSSKNALKIFIGWDSREAECADVLAHSIVTRASIPVEINYLKASELDFHRPHDPLQSTEFTYTRFLVPYLTGFMGQALFLDCDMLVLGDIAELAALDMSDYALRVVKHDHRPTETVKMDGAIQTVYPRKNWSSVMMMNCWRLRLWNSWTVANSSGAFLHRFKGIPDEEIGEIPKEWNVLDKWEKGTKLLHYTSGGPWFEQYKDHPDADLWLTERDQMLAQASSR